MKKLDKREHPAKGRFSKISTIIHEVISNFNIYAGLHAAPGELCASISDPKTPSASISPVFSPLLTP
jgi:hypothetical protein